MVFNTASGQLRTRPLRRREAVAGLCMAWVLGGCAALRPVAPVEPQADVPHAWSTALGDSGALPEARSTVAWWQHFNDPLLTSLVTQALQANTSVLGAQAALRQARALRDATAAGLQPQLTGSGSAQHGTSGGSSTGNVFRAGLDARWELDLFGAQRSALATSEATARASAASLGDVQVSVAAEVALAYIGLRSAQARLTIARDNLASQLQTLQITDWRAQAGLSSGLQVQQARAASAQTQAQLPALQSAITQSAHALAVLTGQAPGALAALLATPAAVPQPGGERALSLPAETLRQRADVRAAEQQVLAATGRVAQADAARYPSFSLSGSLGLSALTLGGLTSGAAVASTLLAGISLPVWDGGAARAQVQAQQAALDQARSAYRGVVLGALKDVEDALVALRDDRERHARLQQAAQAATAAATLSQHRYSAGLIDFQTVLDTQRSQLATQDSLASARADLSADQVRLFKALGGGWTPDDGAAAPTPEPAGPAGPVNR